jgi:3-deoxy-manno-octulosonate cytidylyltransferase (CMP-KDO synthetase)
MKHEILGIIPARYGATRFPGKALAPILGKPMILRVLEGVSGSKYLDDIIVATDNEIILSTVRATGFKAEMTRSDHPSGTDRIWEVAEKHDCDYVLNIQGDEPLITGRVIDSLISILNEKPDLNMATMVKRFSNIDEAQNPNRVKAVVDENGRALYFSRSLIPFPLGRAEFPDYHYLMHVGLYLYKKDFLRKFVEHGQSALERIERLEQLRTLVMGYEIETVLTDSILFSVDTPDDIARVEAYLQGPVPA